jgi:hypothetical protein
MCTVLLPPGVNPTAVKNIYHIKTHQSVRPALICQAGKETPCIYVAPQLMEELLRRTLLKWLAENILMTEVFMTKIWYPSAVHKNYRKSKTNVGNNVMIVGRCF